MKFKGLTATIAAIAIAAPLTLVSVSAATAPHSANNARQNAGRTTEPHAVTQTQDGHRRVDGRNVNGHHIDGRRVDGRHTDGNRADGQRVDGVNGRRVDGRNHDGVNHNGRNDGMARRHRPFIRGYEDGNFRPDHALTRAEFSKMLHNLYGERHVARNTNADIRNNVDGARNTNNVTRNTTNGVRNTVDGVRNTNGVLRNTTNGVRGAFDRVGRNVERAGHNLGRNVERTDRNIERGVERSANTRNFGNVSNHHWARNEIQAIHGLGYFSRINEDRFRADEPVTRAEFFEVLSHINGRAVNDNIQSNRANRNESGTITRGEAVAVLHRLEGRPEQWSGNTRFNDVHESHPHHAHIMHAVNGHS